MAGSSSKQAAHEFFTISQQQSGTKYDYLTASSSEVTLAKKAADPDTQGQLWFKKEAFFLFSKSKPEYALVEQLHPPANSRPIELRPPAMDEGLWTKCDQGIKGLIYIQKASDGRQTSRWKMEPWEPKAQAAIGASGSGSHTDRKRTREDPAGGDPKKTDCTSAQAAIGASAAGSHTDSKHTGEGSAGGRPKKTDCTAGTNTPPMENTQEPARRSGTAEQAAREFFTISQQHSSRTKYYYLTASGRDVTLEEKAADPDTQGQLWFKKEAFFLFSKSKPECALVEQLDPPADNRPIELRPPAMHGLWTKTKCPPANDELIYIQKASDPNLCFVANPRGDQMAPNVVLQQKRKGSISTSRWKMEPWERKAQAAIGASGSGSHTDGKLTGEDPAGGPPKKTVFTPATAPSLVPKRGNSARTTG